MQARPERFTLDAAHDAAEMDMSDGTCGGGFGRANGECCGEH